MPNPTAHGTSVTSLAYRRFFEVRLDFRPRPGDPQGGHDVQETFADFSDFLDTVFRRRRNHGNDVDAMGFGSCRTFVTFFKGISDDDAIHARFLAAGKEFSAP